MIAAGAAALLGCALLAAAPAVRAHDGGATAFASITIAGQTVRYALTVPDAASRALARAGQSMDEVASAIAARVQLTGDDTRCAAAAARVTGPSAHSISRTFIIDYACPRDMHALAIRDDSFDVIGEDVHIIARVEWPGGVGQQALATESRDMQVALRTSAGASRATGFGPFFSLGIEHILIGWDHLLFLAALILPGGSVTALVKIITAFTIAHSMTLGAAALDLVRLPDRLVESAIALSIAWVAAENLWRNDRARPRRWIVAFVFGLVHGFGFSSVLRELGLPAAGLLWSLAGFNLGVEAGQLLCIAVALPVLYWLRTAAWRSRATGTASAVVLAVGLGLFVQRAFL